MKFLSYFLIFGLISPGFSTKDSDEQAEFEADLVEQKDLLPSKLNQIPPSTIQNPLKTDLLGDIVQKALQENSLKKIDNQNYEKADDDDSFDHFLNSLEKDLTDEEDLKRVKVEKNDRSLWSDEGDFEVPKPWKMKNDKKNKFDDESSSVFDDSLISDEDEDDYYYESPENDEYWFLPYDPEIELDKDAIDQAMILGAEKPAKQQSLIIVHETVNIGKIEVNQAPKSLDMPPLADQGLVIIQPDLTQIQGPRSIEHSTEKAQRDVSSSEELKRAEIHAHQKQIQAPRFAGSIPDSRESAAKESRKSAEKKNEKSKEMSTEMDLDLEPINAESSNVADFEYKHRFIHFSKTLSIVDFCIIVLTIVLLGYMISLFCKFIRSLCDAGPKHIKYINDNKVAPVMEKPLPAKEIKIDMSETN